MIRYGNIFQAEPFARVRYRTTGNVILIRFPTTQRQTDLSSSGRTFLGPQSFNVHFLLFELCSSLLLALELARSSFYHYHFKQMISEEVVFYIFLFLVCILLEFYNI